MNRHHNKKIIIFNDYVNGGGVELLLQTLCRNWSKKHNITIALPSYLKNNETKKYFPTNINIKIFPYLENYQVSILNKFIFFLKEKLFYLLIGNFDIAIALKDNYLYKNVLKIKAYKKFAWFHTDITTNPLSQEIMRNKDITYEIIQQYDKIICVSQEAQKGLNHVYGNLSNTVVCYNPLDPEVVVSRAKEKQVLNTDHKIRFVSVGRITYDKGFDLLFKVAKQLEFEGYKFELYMIGNGDLYNEFQDAILKEDLHNIILTGFLDNPLPYVYSSDWYISASRTEGCFTYADQEAVNLNIPVILSHCYGVEEFVDNNTYGIMYEPNYDDLYCVMKRLLDKPELHEYYEKQTSIRKDFLNFKKRIDKINSVVFAE